MYQKVPKVSKLTKVYSHYSGTVNRTATLLCAFDSTDQTVPEECVRWPNWLELTPLRQMTLLKKCTKNVPKIPKSVKSQKSLVSLLWNGRSHCDAIIRVWKHSSSCTRIVLLVTKLVQTDPTSTNDPVPKMYQKCQRGSKLRKVYSHYSGTVNRTA